MKHRDLKLAEAKVRQDRWNRLTLTEKLADLDRRLGKGLGAERQRDRIRRFLQS
jgi:hypothetical protein